MGRPIDQSRQGLRLRPQRRRGSQVPWHAHRTGQGQPLSKSPGRREPGLVRAHEERGISRRLAHAARKDRYGLAESEHARSGDVSHLAHGAPPDRRSVVYLPDVRLRARAVGFNREGDPLDLHARIRRSSPFIQLVYRTYRNFPFAALWVRPAQYHLYRDEQAQTAEACAGRPRKRLGRSTHAYTLGDAATRLYAGGHPQLLRERRRFQDERHYTTVTSRILPARGFEQTCGACDGRAEAAASRH